MIKKLWLSFHARGEHFLPSTVKHLFSEQHDPGAIGKRGRYKGVPQPFGYCEVAVPDEFPVDEKVKFLCHRVSPLVSAIREAGADVMYVSAGYLWKDQCNLEFSTEEMTMLSALGCPLLISCYSDGEDGGEPDARPNAAEPPPQSGTPPQA